MVKGQSYISLPGNDFTIHRKDRVNRTGGDTDLNYLKEFKNTVQLIQNNNKFDQLIICGDFNLPHIDWSTGSATNNDLIHNHFTKTVKDSYLWQLVNFPTRGDNTLDLILTNTPHKVSNVQGFDDILNTDHKLVSFNINLKIQKKPKAKRSIYNFNANWTGLKEMLLYAPWPQCYVPDNINKSLSNWCDLFLSAVDSHIPKYRVKNTHGHPWIDKELLGTGHYLWPGLGQKRNYFDSNIFLPNQCQTEKFIYPTLQ